MIDSLLISVIITLSVIFLGLAASLVFFERRIRQIEKQIESMQPTKTTTPK